MGAIGAHVANAVDRDPPADQIFGAFDVFCRYQAVGENFRSDTEHADIAAAENGGRSFRHTVLRCLCLAGNHGLQQHAAALDEDQLSVKAVFFVQSDVAGEPQRRKLAARRRVSDDNALQGARRGAQEQPRRQKQND